MKTASLQDDDRLQLRADSASHPDCARLRHVSHFCACVHRLSPQSDVLITAWYRVGVLMMSQLRCCFMCFDFVFVVNFMQHVFQSAFRLIFRE